MVNRSTMSELYQKNRLFFLIVIAAAIGFLVWYFSHIVIFIIVAGVISIIGTPLVEMFDRIKIWKFRFPHGLSVTLTLLLMLILFIGMFSLFIPLVIQEAQMISGIDGNQLMTYFQKDISSLQSTLIRYGVMPRGATIESTAKQALLKILDFGLFSNILGSVISFTGSFFFNLFSIVFLSFFFLFDTTMLPRFILIITPEKNVTQIKSVMTRSRTLLSRYFIGLIVQIALNMITYSLALFIIGVKSPLVIGFFTGIIIIIPYLGGVISMLMGVLLGVTGVVATGDFAQILPMTLKILAAMFVVQTIDNNIFAPLIQGKSVKAHPVEIFLVVIAAASFGGIIGMVVAVPVYAFIKIIATEFLSNFRLVRHISDQY
jgi:predicted PurR-regulated permease PerM